jgi:catechol 2,3-dioxygenase-like lactoylglutathione lyase family enzyme
MLRVVGPVSCWLTMSHAATAPALSVMLIVSDAAAAVAWYVDALGAGLLWDLDGVAALQLHGAPFLVHEAVPGKKQEPSPSEVGLTTTRIEVFPLSGNLW